MAGVAHPLPHRYRVRAAGQSEGSVMVEGAGLPPIATEPPPEFGGPEGFWSPETLLLASVADCFILTFRAVARASRLDWLGLDVEVDGVLERVDNVTRFTQLAIEARLDVAAGVAESAAAAALDKAKRGCLITNSLSASCELVKRIVSVQAGPP